jgi:hypothetical protein
MRRTKTHAAPEGLRGGVNRFAIRDRCAEAALDHEFRSGLPKMEVRMFPLTSFLHASAMAGTRFSAAKPRLST